MMFLLKMTLTFHWVQVHGRACVSCAGSKKVPWPVLFSGALKLLLDSVTSVD